MRCFARAVAEVPAFAIGFAVDRHVLVRPCPLAAASAARATGCSSLLTVLLVFLVLIYVQPLRAMARSFGTFLGGSGTPFAGDVGDLFFVYGAGFVAMAATTAAPVRRGAAQSGARTPTRARGGARRDAGSG